MLAFLITYHCADYDLNLLFTSFKYCKVCPPVSNFLHLFRTSCLFYQKKFITSSHLLCYFNPIILVHFILTLVIFSCCLFLHVACLLIAFSEQYIEVWADNIYNMVMCFGDFDVFNSSALIFIHQNVGKFSSIKMLLSFNCYVLDVNFFLKKKNWMRIDSVIRI